MKRNKMLFGWAAIVAALAVCACAQNAPQILLKNRSFKLSTELAFTYEKIGVKFEVEEIYSNWQRRTFVRVRTIEGEPKADENQTPAPGANETNPANGFNTNFYADDQQVLLFGNDLRLYGYKRLASAFTNEFFHSSLLAELPAGSPPLIGPAKFLFYAMANREKLVSSNQGQSNSEFNVYNFNIEGRPRATYSLAYFSNQLKNYPNGIPSSLTAYTETPKQLNIEYKFKSFQLLPDEPIYGPTSSWLRGHFVDASQSVLFDAFSLGRVTSFGALSKIDLSKSSLMSRDYRFSFRAQVNATGGIGDLMHMSVGYEPSIRVLRVNKQSKTRLVELLTNYHTRRTYSMIKRVDSQFDILMDLLIRVRDSANTDISCLASVAEVPSVEQTGSRDYTLGQMLFGSEEFVFLGMARVRGVEVRVFEAFDCAWPVWYQQPLDEGRSQEGGKLYRGKGGPDETVLNIVVYMSYNQGGGGGGGDATTSDLFGGKPLMMEISRVQKRIKRVIEHTRIDMFDFSRELSVAGADDSRVEHFFTLDDSCAVEQSSHYGQMELLLQRDWPLDSGKPFDWLRDSVRRNLALMQALQEKLGIAASLVYDVDTRLVRSSTRSANVDLQEIISVPASMRLMQHVHSEASLSFLGDGRAREELPGRRMFVVEHFQACYLAAAHSKQDSVIFAYSIENSLCIIYPRGADPKSHFDFDSKHKVIRVYQVEHTSAKRQDGDEISVLIRSKSVFSRLQRLSLVDPSDPNSAPFELALKSMEVQELDEERDNTGDHNKFKGLGLVPVGKLNRLVQPTVENLSDEELAHFGGVMAEMSAAGCQAACLADLQCNSYSICVRNSRLECVISKVDFSQPKLVSNLVFLLSKKDAKLGEQFGVGLDTSWEGEKKSTDVMVKRHPGCELHNKIYKDLFATTSRKVEVNLTQRRFRRVKDHEQCAKLCVQATQQVLRDEVSLLRNTSHQALSQPESRPDEIFKAYFNYWRAHWNTCSVMMYFDQFDYLKLDESSQRAIEARVVGEDSSRLDSDSTNYCVLGDDESKPLDSSLQMVGNKQLQVELIQANFEFSFMYDKLQDTSLVASEMSEQLTMAYKHARGHNLKATRSEYQKLKEFLDDGENISQSAGLATGYAEAESYCARLCFIQISGVWPACKSFDLIEFELDTSTRRTSCFFNSITLRDAIKKQKMNLITNKLNDQKRINLNSGRLVRVVHYEPKANLVGESLDAVSLLEQDEAQLENMKTEYQPAVRSFVLFCMFLFALAVGLVAGVKLVAPRVLQGLRASGMTEELLPEFNLGAPTLDAAEDQLEAGNKSQPIV